MFNAIYNCKRHKVLFFIILFIINLISFNSQSQSIVKIKASDNSLTLEYKGLDRLRGGIPLLENGKLAANDLSVINNYTYRFGTPDEFIHIHIKKSSHPEVVGLYLSTHVSKETRGNEFQGVFFSQIPNYKEGVAFYRYKPWNSWTKPVKIAAPTQLETWDNQCFYWQYQDGTYGVAIPISDFGYRTTIGSENGAFGSKALSYVDGYKTDEVPALVIGFGDNLYTLMANAYESAMEFMGSTDNLVKNKRFPDPLSYIGWCTWNASNLGRDLNAAVITRGVESFAKSKFPLGWVLIDDGWFDHKSSQLRSLKPDPIKFPDGFSPLIKKLKEHFHLSHVGVWHAFNGYWNGIDPGSALGELYKNELFAWQQKAQVDVEDSPVVTYHFIKPTSDSLRAFYNALHNYLKHEGFTFIKVDNQLSAERMSVGNYPIGNLAKRMHKEINASAKKYFNNAMINCMDMTSDAYYNFGATPVARSVEDYFPYREGETYNLQAGNAAAHVLQGVYNNLYFSQFVFPDLDMFQSHNPNAEFHAIARAINNGPIYVTDNIGEQNFDILKKLVLNNGKILRADQALLPTQDCLFQVQDIKPFKAFSKSNGIGLLGVWNCADTDHVTGHFSASDINDITDGQFALYERFSGNLQIGESDTKFPIELKRLGYQLYYVAPLKNGVAPLGLLNKYNAPATLINYKISTSQLVVRVQEAGRFGAVLPSHPKRVLVNGKLFKNFLYHDGLCTIDIPAQDRAEPVDLVIAY